jgi:tetratricopeptide (TPR) repeat protein
VERREVLGIAGGVVINIVVPPLPQRGRLGLSDVNRLRQPLAQLIAIDDQVGGVALAAVASRQARRVLDAVERYELSTRVETAMYALAGEYLAAAGWFSVDAEEFDMASELLDQALRAASIARDPLVQAQIWNYMAMCAREARAYTEAHAVAKAGLHSTAARQNPKISALFHARVAHGHAFRGEYGLADRSLSRAHRALERANDTTVTPPWLTFVNEAQLNALSAIAYNALGRHDRAEKFAEQDLDLLPETYVRNRTHGTLHLAEARLGRRQIEHAAHDAFTALDLASELRGGLQTGRVATRLRTVRRRFERWSSVPAARDWIGAYDAAAVAI